MSNCENHKKDLYGHTDMKEVAEAIGDLHYETLAELFERLSDKLILDAAKDRASGKRYLANWLEEAASNLIHASIDIDQAWQISKPFMNPETK